MKTITLEKAEVTINLANIGEHVPIFLIRDKKVIGILVEEDDGWIVKIGGDSDSTGYHETREEAIKRGINLYKKDKFVIDIEIK